MNKLSSKYNLEERTATFGENLIGFCKSLKENTISRSLVSQVIRSGTSIGANYMEANSASSKKDFRNKIYIAKKEAQETKHWLRMLISCYPESRENIQPLWQEAQELTMIFQKITSSIEV